MAIRIGSNISSLSAQRRLSAGTAELANTYQRLSSGLRINKASDDPAGLAISMSLDSDQRVFAQGIRNLNDGVSYLNIAEGALSQLSSITIRQTELAEQAANGSYSTTQRRAMTAEANALGAEFNRIVLSTKFNGQSVIDVSSSPTALLIQAGYGNDGVLSFNLGSDLDRSIGDGTFTAGTAVATLSGPGGAHAFDVNRDGKLDLIARNSTSANVYFGNGDGTFRAPSAYALGGQVNSSQLQDLNGDGRPDLVASNYTTSVVSVVFGNSDGSFTVRTTYATGNFGLLAGVADLNGDGVMDIVNLDDATGEASVLIGNGDGTFLARRSYAAGVASNFSTGTALKDLNGDGRIDLVTSNDSNSEYYVLLGNGDGSFSSKATISTGTNVTSLVTSDVNGDGFQDLLAVGASGLPGLQISLGNGDGSFQAHSLVQTANRRSVLVSDFNGDGLDDISISGTAADFEILLGNGNGTFRAPVSFNTGAGVAMGFLGDFNADGRSDFIMAGFAGNQLSIVLGNGSTTSTIAQLNLNSADGARAALDVLQGQLSRISTELGSIGAHQSRLLIAASNLGSGRENFIAAGSRIKDSDVAWDSAQLVRQNILQQATTSVLSQANQQPALVLQLLS